MMTSDGPCRGEGTLAPAILAMLLVAVMVQPYITATAMLCVDRDSKKGNSGPDRCV
jgi:hypothetical protein